MIKALEIGVNQAWEIGPGAVLSGLAKKARYLEKAFEVLNVDKVSDIEGKNFEGKES